MLVSILQRLDAISAICFWLLSHSIEDIKVTGACSWIIIVIQAPQAKEQNINTTNNKKIIQTTQASNFAINTNSMVSRKRAQIGWAFASQLKPIDLYNGFDINYIQMFGCYFSSVCIKGIHFGDVNNFRLSFKMPSTSKCSTMDTGCNWFVCIGVLAIGCIAGSIYCHYQHLEASVSLLRRPSLLSVLGRLRRLRRLRRNLDRRRRLRKTLNRVNKCPTIKRIPNYSHTHKHNKTEIRSSLINHTVGHRWPNLRIIFGFSLFIELWKLWHDSMTSWSCYRKQYCSYII